MSENFKSNNNNTLKKCIIVNRFKVPTNRTNIMAKSTKSTNNSTKIASSETSIVRSFEPLLSPKDGKARLAFIGCQHSIIEWKKDGQKIIKPILKLVFSVTDVTQENPVNISLTCDYRYNPNNRLGVTLKAMGLVVVDEVEIIDEDDEFGTKMKPIDTNLIFNFLRECAGLVFKSGLQTATKKDKFTGERYDAKGLWEIDFNSIEPYLKKGVQVRDTDADELGDDFTAPKIDIEDVPD